MNFKIKILSLIFFGIILFAFSSSVFAQIPKIEPTGGVVPCGTEANPQPCTLCHLVVGFHNIVQYGLFLITIIALAGVTFAGVMYVLSSGNESMITSSKNFLKASVIGFAVVLAAWLIINQVLLSISAKPDLGIEAINWYTFNCGL